MEIALQNESSEFPRATLDCGERVKITQRRCLDLSVQIVGRKLHGQDLRLIFLVGSRRKETGLAILPSLVRLKALEMAKDESTGFQPGTSRQETTGASVL